jgi:hypothetical protein
MIHHEDLAQTDPLVADCMDHIARQREVITTRYQQGLPTELCCKVMLVAAAAVRSERWLSNAFR